MRVQLRREDGATLLLVTLAMVALLGIAAFAVDLGIAYSNTRQLQKSSDAAALAGASEIIKRTTPTENCAQIVSKWNTNATFRQQVTDAANGFQAANTLVSGQPADIQVRCSSDNKRVEVLYDTRGTTPTIFGKILGVGSLTAQKSATADLFVREEGTGLRPYFVCGGDLGALRATVASGSYTPIKYPSTTTGCSFYNGNWYTSDCPRDANNGTLDENTRNGCLSSVGVVYDQSGGTVTLPNAALESALISECSDATSANPAFDPQTCLISNPGNVASNNVVQAWDYLLTLPGIAIPTFNQAWNDYATAQVAGCRTGGNNGCYPVEALAAVKACAYKWGNNKTARSTDTARCPGVGSLIFPNDNDNYLYLRLINLQFSGASSPGSCPVGGNCDLGARGTRLIR